MSAEIYKVSIVTRPEKLLSLLDALETIDVQGLTVTSVEGFGTQFGITERYRGIEQLIHMIPKILVEIVVSVVPVDEVIRVAKETLKTGNPGDGKIFVSRVTQVVRVRTGETERDALTITDKS
jgi:nitrogen regulatory protein PII